MSFFDLQELFLSKDLKLVTQKYQTLAAVTADNSLGLCGSCQMRNTR